MMTPSVRRGEFDVVVLASPSVRRWPTVGVKRLSLLCAEAGLTVGQFGGPDLRVLGVVPSARTGGWVWIEDAQSRIHRIRARAVVRMSPVPELPDPFTGWRSEAVIPLSTAEELLSRAQTRWAPGVAILGSGNRALRTGSRLLELGVPEVTLVESYFGWGGKRYAGWEVERRRFQILGGRLIEAKPLSLVRRGSLLWEFQLQDDQGIRILEVSSVISAGPFLPSEGIREYPPGSLLFALEQTAYDLPEAYIEGWYLEEERARLLGGKIVRQLSVETSENRDHSERALRKARVRLKRYLRHLETPFLPEYQGKWLRSSDSGRIRQFPGVPKVELTERKVASLECLEEIACNLCEQACPVDAIDFSREGKVLTESLCTGCGACLPACPSRATLMIEAKPDAAKASIWLLDSGALCRPGELITLLNRRGESLGSGRVVGYAKVGDGITAKLVEKKHLVQEEGDESSPDDFSELIGEFAKDLSQSRLICLEIPSHLTWEARGFRKPRPDVASADDHLLRAMQSENDPHAGKVEVRLEGGKRFLREGIPVALALFETGRARAGDALLCPDGSCGLCAVMVDGTKKLACQTRTHARMSIRAKNWSLLNEDVESAEIADSDLLCPCLGLTREESRARIRSGSLLTPEAALRSVPIGEGRCHGQVCGEAFRRLMIEEGIQAQDWIDWRFPWTDWKFRKGEAE